MRTLRRRVLFSALLAGLAITAVAGGIWLAGFLHWHFKIKAAVREAEESIAGPTRITQPEAYSMTLPPDRALNEAGCRAYPYLIAALDPSRKRHFLKYCSLRLVEAVVPFMRPGTSSDEEEDRRDKLYNQFQMDWEIKAVDPPEVVRSKCERIKAWWKEHGRDYHQAWRWWSYSCRGDP